MRGKIIAMAVMITGGTVLPAMAQQESCLNEIQRLETAFTQGGEGGDVRGVNPVPMNQNPGQQPGGLAGAGLSPKQQDDMRAMLREGRAAAERGDSRGCMDKVRQARQLAREATTGAPVTGSGGAGGR